MYPSPVKELIPAILSNEVFAAPIKVPNAVKTEPCEGCSGKVLPLAPIISSKILTAPRTKLGGNRAKQLSFRERKFW